MILLAIISTVLILIEGQIQHKGLHSFPEVDEFGKQIANEFQILRSENIIIATTTGTYEILSVSPNQIPNDGIVTVSYKSSNPDKGDWIGAYSPVIDPSELTSTSPVKYAWCDESVDYLTSGTGSLTFNMTNLRADIRFFYFSSGLSKAQLKTYSNTTVSFININEPLRPRLVATGDYDIFNLLWSSATSTAPVLKWGTASGIYDIVVTAETSAISKSELCGSPANSYGWRDQGLIHTAAFNGMRALASANIYYIFGDSDTNNFSKEYKFRVPPLPGTQPKDRPTTVILYDDMGRGSTDMSYTWNEYGRPSISTAAAVGAIVASGEVDAIYHGGDISYATGYLAVWDFFLDMISEVASRAVYLTTVGNHESDYPNTASQFAGTDSGGECGVLATKLLPMPAPATTDAPWWSYDVGLIHFVGMSTEHDFSVGSKQYEFLENDLASVDRAVTPWIIFGGHRAMYLNSNYGGSPSSDITVMDLMIQELEPLIWKYRVNIGFYGEFRRDNCDVD